MSLINQVLKDLEQRHASEAQNAQAGLQDLKYVSSGKKPEPRSGMWILFCCILVGLGIATVAGYYLFNQYDNWNSPTLVTPQTTPDQQLAQVPKSAPAKKTAPARKVSPPAQASTTRTEAKPESKPQPKTRPAVTSAPAQVTSSEPIEPDPTATEDTPVDTSSVIKKAVPLRSDQKSELAFQDGYTAIRAQQFRKAEKALRKALTHEPGHIKARELLTGLYIKQGRWVEASEVLQHGMIVAPDHNAFTKLYARTLMQMKQDPKAIAILTARQPSIMQDPEHYAILAALYQRQNKHQQAAKTYSDILKVRPKMGIWWVGMGISLEAMGDHRQAAQAYQLAQQSGTLNGNVARYTDNRLLALDAINYPID